MPRKQGGAAADPRWRSHVEPAPGELRIVQALVNTAGAGGEAEALHSPRALAEWLTLWGLLSRNSTIEAAELERMIEIRAGLRALIRANRGATLSKEAVETLHRVGCEATLQTHYFSDGTVRIEPVAEGFLGSLGRLSYIVAMAHGTGRWRRLGLCQREDCGLAFYDFSKGLRGKWCSRRCGNRGSSKTYRGRRKRARTRRLY